MPVYVPVFSAPKPSYTDSVVAMSEWLTEEIDESAAPGPHSASGQYHFADSTDREKADTIQVFYVRNARKRSEFSGSGHLNPHDRLSIITIKRRLSRSCRADSLSPPHRNASRLKAGRHSGSRGGQHPAPIHLFASCPRAEPWTKLAPWKGC